MPDKIDYLIVGGGIAAVCFAKKCIENNNSFRIVADSESSASHVAAGLFNPIVIKRFNPVWRFQHQMRLLQNTFSEFETLLGGKYLHHLPVYRIFSNRQEIVTWKNKIESMDSLQGFLNPHPIRNHFKYINAPFGFGEVKGTGWVDLSSVIRDFSKTFESNYLKESFDFNSLAIDSEFRYKNLCAKHIIFAEGIKVLQNPFFKHIPIRPNKGETLIIEVNHKMPYVTFNSKNFLMPLGNQKFYVGSTYDRTWDKAGPTLENRQKLENQLEFYFKGNYKVVEHRAAFRPTTPNMRPIVGPHPAINNMYVLNGLGTRGTFNGPDMARELFSYIEYDKPLSDEINVYRYYKHWVTSTH